MEYPIPKKSAEAWRAFQRTNTPHNPGLIFDRFVQNWGQNSGKEAKKEAWKEVETAAKKLDTTLLQNWNTRWEKTVRHVNAEPFKLKTDWRFVAGLGHKGSLEVGFTFHRYGFPFLPGSSVKGIARAYAWLVEERRETGADFLNIFGRAPQRGEEEGAAQSGHAIFFDAIPAPARLPKLELDVMTPHYPDYYGDKNNRVAPTDSQSPIPVYFLTVAPGVEFRFAVGWRGEFNDEARHLRSLAQDWLLKGLAELGAGAKTSAGYGYFVPARR
jgi:CRISPR-associated protein Cmr6